MVVCTLCLTPAGEGHTDECPVGKMLRLADVEPVEFCGGSCGRLLNDENPEYGSIAGSDKGYCEDCFTKFLTALG